MSKTHTNVSPSSPSVKLLVYCFNQYIWSINIVRKILTSLSINLHVFSLSMVWLTFWLFDATTDLSNNKIFSEVLNSITLFQRNQIVASWFRFCVAIFFWIERFGVFHCDKKWFTLLWLCVFLQKLRHTESDRLAVQVNAYLDNMIDVATLLEDSDTKNAALEKVAELEDALSHVR